MTRKQHLHKYRRVDIGRDTEYWVLQCQLPHCSHYFPMKTKMACPSLEGKIAICNRCGDAFTLDRRALRQAKPSCEACIRNKSNEAKIAARFFANLEKDSAG